MRYPLEIIQICKFTFSNEFQSGIGWAAINFQIWAGHYVIQKKNNQIKKTLLVTLVLTLLQYLNRTYIK